jgi:hypothetical protein
LELGQKPIFPKSASSHWNKIVKVVMGTSQLTQRAQMKWEVKGVQEIDDMGTGREEKTAIPHQHFRVRCAKALTGVV